MSKLRIVEAFSGVGSQKMGVRNLNIDHEIVATMEIDKHAIISYGAIHHDLEKHLNYKNQNAKEEKEYLENLGVLKVPKRKKRLHQCYIASKLANNLGDISLVKEEEIPEHDLLTYSFPCTDISSAGKQKGLDKDSGTKSSLLWQCERIIKYHKPQFLMLENVKNLVSKTHKENFMVWLNELEKLGYTNYWEVLDAKEHGIPQNRERVFVISILNNNKSFNFPEKEELTKKLKDYLSSKVDKKFILTDSKKSNYERDFGSKGKYHTLEDDYCQTLTAAMGAGGGNKPVLKYKNKNGKDEYREFTPKECWLLMGFSEEDFEKANKFNSKTQLYKQAGNSIALRVLEKLFSEMVR
jgi:DNA (cytosine-5)-methyltransferase 1